jgi:hypothetical protein
MIVVRRGEQGVKGKKCTSQPENLHGRIGKTGEKYGSNQSVREKIHEKNACKASDSI